MLLCARMRRIETRGPRPETGYYPGPSSRARAIGVLLTVLLHVGLLLAILLKPSQQEVEPTAILPAITFVALGPERPAAPPASPPAVTAPAPVPPRPVSPPPTPRIVFDRAPDPLPPAQAAVAPAAPDSTDLSMNDAAPSRPMTNRGGAPGVRQPNCVPIPYAWLGRVARMISDRQRYPALARQRGERGTAYVRLNVDRSGRVLEAPIARSSGFPRLDAEAQDVMRRIGSFGRVPDSACPGWQVIVIDQPVSFAGG